MDSLQIAVAAYIAEHGSVDANTFQALTDLYTTEISDDVKMSLIAKRRAAYDDAHKRLTDHLSTMDQVKKEKDSTRNPIKKLVKTNEEKALKQKLEDASADTNKKVIKLCVSAANSMGSAATSVKKIMDAVRERVYSNEIIISFDPQKMSDTLSKISEISVRLQHIKLATKGAREKRYIADQLKTMIATARRVSDALSTLSNQDKRIVSGVPDALKKMGVAIRLCETALQGIVDL